MGNVKPLYIKEKYMTKEIELLLEKIIETLESLPTKICEEQEKRELIRQQLANERTQADLDFYRENNEAINRFMYRVAVTTRKKDE